ncbi:hypothetical protein C8J56DRAFT_1096526 [Mycena floridula]|nr:hypothetical protein C8J56DRAFT_1096526 [Mycena floridula]
MLYRYRYLLPPKFEFSPTILSTSSSMSPSYVGLASALAESLRWAQSTPDEFANIAVGLMSLPRELLYMSSLTIHLAAFTWKRRTSRSSSYNVGTSLDSSGLYPGMFSQGVKEPDSWMLVLKRKELLNAGLNQSCSRRISVDHSTLLPKQLLYGLEEPCSRRNESYRFAACCTREEDEADITASLRANAIIDQVISLAGYKEMTVILDQNHHHVALRNNRKTMPAELEVLGKNG